MEGGGSAGLPALFSMGAAVEKPGPSQPQLNGQPFSADGGKAQMESVWMEGDL